MKGYIVITIFRLYFVGVAIKIVKKFDILVMF